MILRFLFLGLIRSYQLCVSPLLPVACRFAPTCSQYAHEAVTAHGAFRGSILALNRIARCHPFGKSGFDPVPTNPEKGATNEE